MYNNPVKVIETDNYVQEVSGILSDSGIREPLIITSPSIVRLYHIDEVFPQHSVFIVDQPNPDIISCQKALDFSKTKDHDAVIAIGGGSVMDTAKVVLASLGSGIYDVHDLLHATNPVEKKIPSVFIPTTHGSGSEVTMWATVWDLQEKRKYSLSHPVLYPDIAILDASLVLELPVDISLTTSLDALSHSFEAIWNINNNPVSTTYAIEAICLILENIDALKNDPKNPMIRKKLLQASNIAGLAFSNTKTAAAHSISYPLTMDFNIPHGIAASLTLVSLLKKQKSLIQEELGRIIAKLGLNSVDALIEKIRSIPAGCLKYRLRDWNVKENDLSYLADESFSNDRINNNKAELSREDVHQILSDIY